MYVPNHFKPSSDAAILTFLQKNSFGILVSQQDQKPIATHVPFFYVSNGENHGTLVTHIARANPQWKNILDQPVMVIFSEPHAYISSSWYSHLNVPTWNYVAVHVYGRTKILEGEALKLALKTLVDHYEANRPNAFTIEAMTEQQLNRQMRGIVGLSIEIKEIEATYKLSQNRSDADFKNIINQLKATADPLAHEIANHMQESRLSSK